ncbi:unnamed protein product [Dicrocoelium dendriticum]|nr:unnamed protein product [Dicrocoelium dendriticum]
MGGFSSSVNIRCVRLKHLEQPLVFHIRQYHTHTLGQFPTSQHRVVLLFRSVHSPDNAPYQECRSLQAYQPELNETNVFEWYNDDNPLAHLFSPVVTKTPAAELTT